MYASQFQGRGALELLSGQGKDPVRKFHLDLQGGIRCDFNKTVKSKAYAVHGGPQTRITIPSGRNKKLGVTMHVLALQLYIPPGDQFSLEIHVADTQLARHRLLFSTKFREITSHSFHAQLPLPEPLLPPGEWVTLCIDLAQVLSACFTGTTFRTCDLVQINSSCFVRKVFALSTPPIRVGALDTVEDHITSDLSHRRLPHIACAVEQLPRECSYPSGVNPGPVILYDRSTVINMQSRRGGGFGDGESTREGSQGTAPSSSRKSTSTHARERGGIGSGTTRRGSAMKSKNPSTLQRRSRPSVSHVDETNSHASPMSTARSVPRTRKGSESKHQEPNSFSDAHGPEKVAQVAQKHHKACEEEEEVKQQQSQQQQQQQQRHIDENSGGEEYNKDSIREEEDQQELRAIHQRLVARKKKRERREFRDSECGPGSASENRIISSTPSRVAASPRPNQPSDWESKNEGRTAIQKGRTNMQPRRTDVRKGRTQSQDEEEWLPRTPRQVTKALATNHDYNGDSEYENTPAWHPDSPRAKNRSKSSEHKSADVDVRDSLDMSERHYNADTDRMLTATSVCKQEKLVDDMAVVREGKSVGENTCERESKMGDDDFNVDVDTQKDSDARTLFKYDFPADIQEPVRDQTVVNRNEVLNGAKGSTADAPVFENDGNDDVQSVGSEQPDVGSKGMRGDEQKWVNDDVVQDNKAPKHECHTSISSEPKSVHDNNIKNQCKKEEAMSGLQEEEKVKLKNASVTDMYDVTIDEHTVQSIFEPRILDSSRETDELVETEGPPTSFFHAVHVKTTPQQQTSNVVASEPLAQFHSSDTPSRMRVKEEQKQREEREIFIHPEQDQNKQDVNEDGESDTDLDWGFAMNVAPISPHKPAITKNDEMRKDDTGTSNCSIVHKNAEPSIEAETRNDCVVPLRAPLNTTNTELSKTVTDAHHEEEVKEEFLMLRLKLAPKGYFEQHSQATKPTVGPIEIRKDESLSEPQVELKQETLDEKVVKNADSNEMELSNTKETFQEDHVQDHVDVSYVQKETGAMHTPEELIGNDQYTVAPNNNITTNQDNNKFAQMANDNAVVSDAVVLDKSFAYSKSGGCAGELHANMGEIVLNQNGTSRTIDEDVHEMNSDDEDNEDEEEAELRDLIMRKERLLALEAEERMDEERHMHESQQQQQAKGGEEETEQQQQTGEEEGQQLQQHLHEQEEQQYLGHNHDEQQQQYAQQSKQSHEVEHVQRALYKNNQEEEEEEEDEEEEEEENTIDAEGELEALEARRRKLQEMEDAYAQEYGSQA